MTDIQILYHYFHPDDVVSSRHLSELAEGLAARGWAVAAKPCNRGCRQESLTYLKAELWRSVNIHRVWRPRFPQASSLGRLANALWMICAWSVSALHPKRAPRILIVGTDPILGVLIAIPWKLMRPNTKVVHWCFDVYPDAAVASRTLKPAGLVARIARALVRVAYGRCDVIADIGPCMRELLSAHPSPGRRLTLTPWALLEPAAPLKVDLTERSTIFGDASLALMYSGNLGRAHSHAEIFQLAERLRNSSVKIVFSVRGNCAGELRRALAELGPTNVEIVSFAAEDGLGPRLSAADIHVVTLRDEWTGTVVPSKFFGALAVGRPVLFVGSSESSIARWIRQYQVGWVVEPGHIDEAADELRDLASSPSRLTGLFRHCHAVYQQHFAKDRVIDAFSQELRAFAVARRPIMVDLPATMEIPAAKQINSVPGTQTEPRP